MSESIYFYFYFLMILEFEFSTLHLLGRYSTAWAMQYLCISNNILQVLLRSRSSLVKFWLVNFLVSWTVANQLKCILRLQEKSQPHPQLFVILTSHFSHQVHIRAGNKFCSIHQLDDLQFNSVLTLPAWRTQSSRLHPRFLCHLARAHCSFSAYSFLFFQ
jgi:hypothetical protein